MVRKRRRRYWIKRALGTKRRRGVRRGHHRKRFRVEARHKGALHRALGVPMGEKIPLKKLRSAARRGGHLGKMARFALTARRFRHLRRKR